MAEKGLRSDLIGVGSALRRARQIRGISLDEASRDTKLRTEQLEALEEEEFESQGGEVFVRAQLRTYSQYLGLNPEKVVGAYARHAEEPEPPPPPGKLSRVDRAIAASRVRDNQRFLLVAAAVVLVALVSVGLVSRKGAPEPAALPTDLVAADPVSASGEPKIDVAIEATAEVEVSAVVDGELVEPRMLRAGEVVSFTAVEELTVNASDGGKIDVTVSGEALGAPGPTGRPWSQTYVANEVVASQN
jgi:cytoskeletal protein RodZ